MHFKAFFALAALSLAICEAGVLFEYEEKKKLGRFPSATSFLMTSGISSSELALSPTQALSENINVYVDRVMIKLGPYLMRRGFFPTYLPDFIDQVIEYNPLLITYTGELHLTNGQLNQLVSVARTGNAEMSNDRGMLRVSLAASIKQVAWTYDYSAALMGLGPSGWLEGNTDQMTFSFAFIVDDYDHHIYLQDFKVTSYGNMELKLRGNSLIDWFSNVIVDASTTLFKGPMTDFISDRFKYFIQEAIDEMNRNNFAYHHQDSTIEEVLQGILAFIEKH